MAIHITLHESFIKELVVDENTEETVNLENYLNIIMVCDVHKVYSTIPVQKEVVQDSKITEAIVKVRMLSYLHDYGCDCPEDMIGGIPTYNS